MRERYRPWHARESDPGGARRRVESPAWQRDGSGKSATPGTTRASGTTSWRRRAKAYVQPERAFENPETKRRFRNLLDVTGVLDQLVQLRARPATDEEILRVHTPAHLAHVRALGATGGDAGEGTHDGQAGATRSRVLAAGGSDRRGRRRPRRHRRQRLRARAPARPPRRARAARWASASSRTSASRSVTPSRCAASAASQSSTGTSTTATAPRRSSSPTRTCSRSRCTRTSTTRRGAAASTSSARAPGAARTSTSRCRPAAASRPTATPSSASSCRRCARSGPS